MATLGSAELARLLWNVLLGFTYLVSDELDVNVGHELGLIIVPVTVFLPGKLTPIKRLSGTPFVQFRMRRGQAGVRI
jgi:hypothetical protein